MYNNNNRKTELYVVTLFPVVSYLRYTEKKRTILFNSTQLTESESE